MCKRKGKNKNMKIRINTIGNLAKGEQLSPRIGALTTTKTSNNINLQVTITRLTGEVRLSYYYK